MQHDSVLQSSNDLGLVNTALEDYLQARTKQATKLHRDYGQLWLEITRVVLTGGKRLRPQLALMSNRLLGGQQTSAVVQVSAAVELLHVSMLIHDDFIDRDYIRHNAKNVAGAYADVYKPYVGNTSDRLHYAHGSAVLAGDLLLSEAYQMLNSAAIGPTKVHQIQRLFGQSIFEVIGGELLDTEAAFRHDDGVTSELIATYKTASYSFILPLLVGAELANASTDQVRQLKLLGHNLGIAYQLKDDVLGVFGETAKTGKSNLSDLREGKQTYLVEQFYKLASAEQRSQFNTSFGSAELTESDAKTLRQLLIDSGALSQTEAAIGKYVAEAQQAAKNLLQNGEPDSQLEELFAKAAVRTY